MTVIAVPATVRFQNFEITLDAVSEEFTSSFNGKRQIAKKPFDVWLFQGDLVPLDANDAGSVRSFLMKLAERVNSFRLKIAGSKYPVSGYMGPPGTTDGAPLYDGGLASSYIKIVGLTPGALVLKDGDYFNIGDELKVATLDRVADGAGVAFVYFMPALRKTTTGQALTLTDPFLYLHAADDDVASWKVTAPVRHAFKLKAEEEL